MKRIYQTPAVERLEFNYTENVVASSGNHDHGHGHEHGHGHGLGDNGHGHGCDRDYWWD